MSLRQGNKDSLKLRRLCICADDFGFHSGLDQGIVELAQSGRLSATSCLTEGPSWLSGASDLKDLAGRAIDCGLHVNFTESFDGKEAGKNSLNSLIFKAYSGQLQTNTIQTAISKQLSLFEEAMGRAPDFVDGHQHVHQLPIIRDCLIDELSRRYSRHPWIRNTQPADVRSNRNGLLEQLKSRIIFSLGGASLNRAARSKKFLMNHRFLGVYGFNLNFADYLDRLRQWCDQAKDLDLLMCHPGLDMVNHDGIGQARNVEFAVLSSDEFGKILDKHNITISRLSNCLS